MEDLTKLISKICKVERILPDAPGPWFGDRTFMGLLQLYSIQCLSTTQR